MSASHDVEKARYAEFARWKDSEFVDNPSHYWNLFVRKAREVVEQRSEAHDFKSTDLILGQEHLRILSLRFLLNLYILVTGLGKDYRMGIYSFSVQDDGSGEVVPPNLSFLEFTDPNDVRAVEWHPDGASLSNRRIETWEER